MSNELIAARRVASEEWVEEEAHILTHIWCEAYDHAESLMTERRGPDGVDEEVCIEIAFRVLDGYQNGDFMETAHPDT